LFQMLNVHFPKSHYLFKCVAFFVFFFNKTGLREPDNDSVLVLPSKYCCCKKIVVTWKRMGGRIITPPFLTSTVVSFTLRPLYPLSPPAGKCELAPFASSGGLGENEKFFTSAAIETRSLFCPPPSLIAIPI